MNYAVVINFKKPNLYSFSALIGALELDERLTAIDLILVKDKLINSLNNLLKKFDKIIVCYSLMSSQALEAYYEIKKLRSFFGNKIYIIGGGPYPTGNPNEALRIGFDIIVVGEGEKNFPELIYRLVTNRDYIDLSGIAFKHGEEVIINRSSTYVNLDNYPPFAVKHKLLAPIEISRGCPWTCKFCQTPRIFGFKMRHRSVECVTKYVKMVVRGGYKNIWFTSPNSFAYGSPNGKRVDTDKIRMLLSSLREIEGVENIFFGTFPSEVRPESVIPEVLNVVIQNTSNRTLVIGAQSGSERILRLSARGHTVEDVYRAVNLTLSVGLTPHLDFIFGLPSETKEDLDLTKNMIIDCVNKGSKIHAHVFIPLHGTPYQNENSKPLDKEIRKWLIKLKNRGSLTGYWDQHIGIGRKLSKYNKIVSEESLKLISN